MNTLKFVYAKSFVVLLAMAASVAISVQAQTYVGGTFGPSRISLSGENATTSFLDLSVATPSIMLTDRNLSYGLKLRYQAAPHLALEANYSDLRASSIPASFAPGAPSYADAYYVKTRANAKGYGLDLVGTLPLLDRLTLTGRAGIQSVRNESTFSGLGGIDSSVVGGLRPFSQSRFGLGVQYSLTKSVGLRLEMERFHRLSGNTFGSEFSADNVSFGVLFKF